MKPENDIQGLTRRSGCYFFFQLLGRIMKCIITLGARQEQGSNGFGGGAAAVRGYHISENSTLGAPITQTYTQ